MRAPGLSIRLLPVAIGAADLALGHFRYDALEGNTSPRHIADAELFFANVIEFKHYRVGLSAVYAGVRFKIFENPRMDYCASTLVSRFGLGLDRVPISLVIPAFSQLLPYWIASCHGRCVYHKSGRKNIGGGGSAIRNSDGGSLGIPRDLRIVG
jgi:hypothetical protein